MRIDVFAVDENFNEVRRTVDIENRGDIEINWGNGWVNVLENGNLHVMFRDPESDEPFVLIIDGTDQRIVSAEDLVPVSDAPVVWRSRDYKPGGSE